MSRAALRRLTPLARPLPSLLPRPPAARPFFSLPNIPSPPQTLTATRTLPYPASDLYALVADVDAYEAFVPYCSASRVTARQPEPPHAPTRADLRVGWGGFEETFTSRLRCLPDRSVEAVSGADAGSGSGTAGAVFTSLVTRWDLRPDPSAPAGGPPATQVDLVIRFQFANPLYSAVSAAVSDKVAGVMIEAFEKRARRILGRPAL